MEFQVRLHTRYGDIPQQTWDDLIDSDCPFTRHAFLSLMEQHAGAQQSWDSMPLSIEGDGATVFVMPLYKRMDSHGEFVFDYIWANAYHRANFDYYPKLVSAVPFSPIEGPRWGVAEGHCASEMLALAQQAIAELAGRDGYSSWHILYPDPIGALEQQEDLHLRTQCRFHWHNRGYSRFDDWLEQMSARKRKSIRRERRIVRDNDLEVRAIPGGAISREQWREFYWMYQSSYLKRGMYGYLPEEFFVDLTEIMPANLVLFRATRKGECVATSLCLRDDKRLYGRYWGCLQEYDCLHFEACYYSTVEYCIEHALQEFDSGVQGERNKVPRGFEPKLAYSAHWFAHPAFGNAVRQHLEHEREHIQKYCDALRTALPYKKLPAS